MATFFEQDDNGYLAWLTNHPAGFVLNVRAAADPNYVVLHQASCYSISCDRADGAYTGRGYRKICATDLAELHLAAKAQGRADGSFSRRCGHCLK